MGDIEKSQKETILQKVQKCNQNATFKNLFILTLIQEESQAEQKEEVYKFLTISWSEVKGEDKVIHHLRRKLTVKRKEKQIWDVMQ